MKGWPEGVLYLAELSSLHCGRPRRQGCINLGLALAQPSLRVAGCARL